MCNQFLFFVLLLSFFTESLGITIGSDTTVNRFNTQQILNTGDRIASFAALAGGIALTSLATTATWSSVFPLSGTINLRGGTLILYSDFIMRDNTQIASFGSFQGQGHIVELASSCSFIQTASFRTSVTLRDVDLFLNNDLTLNNCNIKFSGNCILNGQGTILTLNAPSFISLDSNSILTLQNITLKGVRPNQFFALSATSTYLFKNVLIDLDTNYSFTNGRFEVANMLDIQGDGFSFAYQSTATSVVRSNSRLLIDQGLTFSYAPTNSNKGLLTFADPTAQLYINGGILYTASQGIILKQGTLLVNQNSFFVNNGAVTKDSGIIVGDGSGTTNDMVVRIFPAGVINVTRGYFVYRNV